MSHQPPSILVVDDSPHFRSYLSREFSRASWSVHEWDPQTETLEALDRVDCQGLTAAIADWHLGAGLFNGLEVLSAVREKNGQAACVLYTIRAMEEEWRLASEDARKAEILALEPGSRLPEDLYRRVVEEVKRRMQGFEEPRQTWEDYEAWIRPDPDPPDPRLAQAVESVGRRHLVPIIQGLFPERGPQHPIRYTFLNSGFSGARVFLLKDAPGSPSPSPRYIVKVAQGNDGFETLRSERARFQDLVLGSEPHRQTLVGYVAEEIRPASVYNEPVGAHDAWFGIAYREVGNGAGRVTPLREWYLEVPGEGQEKNRHRQLARFFDRLYSDCLGRWYQHNARSANRRLWASGPGADACYYFPAKKRLEIFAALDELKPRVKGLLDRLCGTNTTDRLHLEIIAFIEQGRCNRRIYGPTLFHPTFQVLEAGTHGDLHAGNVLVMDRQGELDPFLIDFSEFQEHGHPFYDYARLENDIRLRLMSYEDGSDILDEMLREWLSREEHLTEATGEKTLEEPPIFSGSIGFIDKGYWLIAVIRTLAYQNLSLRLKDQSIRLSRESFDAQYTSALLHRTLISLASTDIVEEKKILAFWLSANLISRLGTLMDRLAG